MVYFTIKNWELFQHYKDRRPPWIKLHVQLLNDRSFMALALASRGLLMLLWILASEDGGRVPYDRDELVFRLRIEKFTLKDLNPLFSAGFLVPDNECKQMLADASVCLPSVSVSVSVSEGGVGGSTNRRPTLEEVRAYVAEQGFAFDPEAWMAHYEANGWRVGRNPMKDWKAACRTWAKSEFRKPAKPAPVAPSRTERLAAEAVAHEHEEGFRAYERAVLDGEIEPGAWPAYRQRLQERAQ